MSSLTCNLSNMVLAVPCISQMMGYPSLIYSTGHQFLMHPLKMSEIFNQFVTVNYQLDSFGLQNKTGTYM